VLLALAPARAEAVPAGTVEVVVDPLGALLPARRDAPARPSAASCLLDREPRRTCRAPRATLQPVPGRSPHAGRGRLLRYQVRVEGGLAVEQREVTEEVERILADPRGWIGSGRIAFQRVAAGPIDFRVVLARPATVDRLCYPLLTRGSLSCATGARAVLNVRRWRHGAPAFAGDLELYRRYLVNHEVGHLLGHGHRSCQRTGAPAPVMMQQTKGVGACRPNGRPLPWERG